MKHFIFYKSVCKIGKYWGPCIFQTSLILPIAIRFDLQRSSKKLTVRTFSFIEFLRLTKKVIFCPCDIEDYGGNLRGNCRYVEFSSNLAL